MRLLDTWGAFTIGVMVAALVGILLVCFQRSVGAWLPDPGLPPSALEPKALCARNVAAAFNPVGNLVRCLYRPAAVKGPDHYCGLDGVRALAFLWVFAWQINEFLAVISDDYAESNWYAAKDEQVVPWKIASQGYEGLSIFLALSAFLLTKNLLTARQSEASRLGLIADVDESFYSSATGKYAAVFWRRFMRLWPSLAAAVFFVGFIWGEYVNTKSNVIDHNILDECKKRWWTNIFFVGNFWESTCFRFSWAVSLLAQLSFLAPLPAFLFSTGRKPWAYFLVYAFIFLGLVSRSLTVFLFHINWGPTTGDAAEENEYYLQRMPWCRASEFCVGILCALSAAEAEAAEGGREKRDQEESGGSGGGAAAVEEATTAEDEESRPLVGGGGRGGKSNGGGGGGGGAHSSILDIYYLVDESMRDWLQSPALLFVTFLQTATIAVGFLFVFEGTLQYHEMNFNMTNVGKGCVLVVGDTIVASLFALLIKWASSEPHGGWLRAVLSWPVWYPVASLSYNAFLYAWPAAFWAKEVIANTPKGNYTYFAKEYFLSFTFAMFISLAVSVCIERPLLKLSRLE